ncbi:MAG: hypothetical protein LQ340_007701, partial [Diploschistes diacapsis]
MRAFDLAALAVALPLNSAAHSTKRKSAAKQGFKISQVANADFLGRNGPAQHAKAMAKYNVIPKTNVIISSSNVNVTGGHTASNTGNGSTSDTVTGSYIDGAILEYLSPVTIGGK